MRILRRRIRNMSGEVLHGDLHSASDGGDLVIVCHGFGKTWNKNRPLYRSICSAFQSSGINAFRFSFSGIAPSEGNAEDSSYTKQKSDLAAVIEYFSAKLRPRAITIVAHSFSSVAAVLQAAEDPRIRLLLLVAPRLDSRKSMTTAAIEAYCGKRLEEIVASPSRQYPIGPINLGGIEYLFSKRFLEDLIHTDIPGAIAHLSIPVTIVRGVRDTKVSEEEVLGAVSRNALVSYIPLAECGHSFSTPEQKESLCRTLLKAFRSALPQGPILR